MAADSVERGYAQNAIAAGIVEMNIQNPRYMHE
jgi:hypothetical protein